MKTTTVLSLNRDWSFHLGDMPENKSISHGEVYNTSKAGSVQGPPSAAFDARNWQNVDLPHDYLIGCENDLKSAPDWGYKPKCNGWYRKCFTLPDEYSDKRLKIRFEGVSTHCVVYFNGSVAKRNFSGYNDFTVDITDRAIFGGAPNVLAVYVDGTSYEGWWYEGAGIYRPVTLTITNKRCFEEQPYIKCSPVDGQRWLVQISCVLSEAVEKDCVVRTEIFDDKGKCVCSFEGGSGEVCSPKLWSVDSPNLYTAKCQLLCGGTLCDCVSQTIGFRYFEITSDKGFFLNGKPLKIYGTCNHQDFAGVGSALTDSLWLYKVKRLKDMGCNAYRSSHGMAADGLVKACDKLGIILMDENRNYESSEECLEQLRAMVKRDRNHPCVMFYSLFNEEPLQGTVQGKNIAVTQIREIRKLDDTRIVTGAMNGGVFEEDGSASAVDMLGLNYQIYNFDKAHEKYPDFPIIGSENASYFQTRGCTKTDYKAHTFSCYDEDCADWGNNIRDTWQAINSRDFVAGGFVWTGFDYLGEPTPHVYPSVSSFFGLMDSCGFAKGGYYLSKAIWSDKPYVRILPDFWDFEDGETVRVMSAANCEEAELFVNGKSCGRHNIDKYVQHIWETRFERGEIRLVGYNGGEEACSHRILTPSGKARIALKPNFAEFNAQTTAIPITVSARDKDGLVCPRAADKITFEVTGGKILGTGNGDPNCHEPFNTNERSLFCGLAMVTILADDGAKSVKLTAAAEGLEAACIEIPVNGENREEFVPSVKEIYLTDWRMSAVTEIPLSPNVQLSDCDMNSWQSVSTQCAPSELVGKEGKYVLYRTVLEIPTAKSGGRILRFNSLWGEAEIYINGKLCGHFSSEWASMYDMPFTAQSDSEGKYEITLRIKSLNKYGAGINGNVLLLGS